MKELLIASMHALGCKPQPRNETAVVTGHFPHSVKLCTNLAALESPLQAPFADCPYEAPSSHSLWVPGAPGSLVCPWPSMLISVSCGFATVFAASFVLILYLQPDGKFLPELRRNKCYRPTNTLLQKRLILHPTTLLPCIFQNHLPHYFGVYQVLRKGIKE